MNPKFQPMPKRISATKKFPKVTPARAAIPANVSTTNPTAIILGAPNLTIRWPVKNDGINMAKTCPDTISLALSLVKPQPTTANGVDVQTVHGGGYVFRLRFGLWRVGCHYLVVNFRRWSEVNLGRVDRT